MKRTDEEVDRIIAEFMGRKIRVSEFVNSVFFDEPTNQSMVKYTKSLDSLVPVWEKLESDTVHLCLDTYTDGKAAGFYNHGLISGCAHFYRGFKTIQQAAAHATAEAILELEK